MSKILILMYHMISVNAPGPEKKYAVPLERFRKHMSYLKSGGFSVVNMEMLRSFYDEHGKHILPEKPVVITFDDGYIDHYENALPVLKEYGFPAVFFVVAGYIGKSNDWRIFKDCPRRRLVGWREIREMQENGMTIGSHSMGHAFLTRLSYDDAERDIRDSKKYLEDKTGRPIVDFAYPYGDNDDTISRIVKMSGYKTACTTMSGFNTEKGSIFRLKRIDISGADNIARFAAKTRLGTGHCNPLVPVKRTLRKAVRNIFR